FDLDYRDHDRRSERELSDWDAPFARSGFKRQFAPLCEQFWVECRRGLRHRYREGDRFPSRWNTPRRVGIIAEPELFAGARFRIWGCHRHSKAQAAKAGARRICPPHDDSGGSAAQQRCGEIIHAAPRQIESPSLAPNGEAMLSRPLIQMLPVNCASYYHA